MTAVLSTGQLQSAGLSRLLFIGVSSSFTLIALSLSHYFPSPLSRTVTSFRLPLSCVTVPEFSEYMLPPSSG
jgi:hypothetical protein